MMMMNIPVVLSSILAIASGTIDDECRNVCTDVKRAASFKTGCSAFRNSLPKPKVRPEHLFKSCVAECDHRAETDPLLKFVKNDHTLIIHNSGSRECERSSILKAAIAVIV